MKTYLDAIVAWHRRRAANDGRNVAELISEANASKAPVNFRSAIEGGEAIAVISEIKRRSPSKGDLNLNLDVTQLAHAYEAGGASALSVLTDTEFFSGSAQDLRTASSSVSLPILRKDFTVCEADIADARIMGASAVLLIAAALSDEELERFAHLANELQLGSLFEVHSEHELERVLHVGAEIVGVNQRDLFTFEVDRFRALKLIDSVPLEILRVAESGIESVEQVGELAERGFDAILIGETLVRSSNPSLATSEFASIPRASGRRQA